MVDVGIMNENTRKLISNDDSGDKSVATDKQLLKVFNGRIKIKLGKILNDHGLYAPYGMKSNVRYRVRLPSSSNIVVAQTNGSVHGYTLEDIKLEYVTIEDSSIYNLALNSNKIGRSLTFEHITMMEREILGKDTTLINRTINLPR